MKNASPYIVIILLFLSFAGGFYYGKSDLKKELRNSAGLNESKLKESQVQILALKGEIKLREDSLDQMRSDRASEQQELGLKLKQLRSKPPVFVETTTIQIAECDSILMVSQSLSQEIRKMDRIRADQVQIIAKAESNNDFLYSTILLQSVQIKEDSLMIQNMNRQARRLKHHRNFLLGFASMGCILIALL